MSLAHLAAKRNSSAHIMQFLHLIPIHSLQGSISKCVQYVLFCLIFYKYKLGAFLLGPTGENNHILNTHSNHIGVHYICQGGAGVGFSACLTEHLSD